MRFWYVELEPLASRYTEDLCRSWYPDAFSRVSAMIGAAAEFVRVRAPEVPKEIVSGKVLDAESRGIVALSQCAELLKADVGPDDIVFLQDFWTPGVEALAYSWQQKLGRLPRMYARNFAQSVDEYDFTWPMRSWMRPIEIGLSRMLSGMFVASTIHRDQLRAAGYECPIHVTGLPFSSSLYHESRTKSDLVLFTSRMDDEKNPWFMLDVAQAFMRRNTSWSWAVTTSASSLKDTPVVRAAWKLASHEERFRIVEGLSKEEYRTMLADAAIVFNSSLQDYVAFTMLEASASGCDLCYPDFRSFKECVEPSRRYEPFRLESALEVLSRCVSDHTVHVDAVERCQRGLMAEIAIMLRGWDGPELNVWHHPESMITGEGLLA